jgi:hypothetical protein
MQKIYIVIIAFSVLAFVGVCSAANWQTVTTFTGGTGQTTDYFNVPTNEWRIVWTITPEDPNSGFGGFYTFVYPKGESALYVDSIDGDSSHTSGTTYIHEGSKEYYLKVGASNLQSYTITIEYDTTAIPEYSTIAIIITLALVSMSVIAVRKKLKKPNS